MTLSKEKFEHILAYAKQQQKLGVHHCNILPDDMVEIMEMAAGKMERGKQEPVAWVMKEDLCDKAIISTPAYREFIDAKEFTGAELMPLYAAPPATSYTEAMLRGAQAQMRCILGDLELHENTPFVEVLNAINALKYPEPLTLPCDIRVGESVTISKGNDISVLIESLRAQSGDTLGKFEFVIDSTGQTVAQPMQAPDDLKAEILSLCNAYIVADIGDDEVVQRVWEACQSAGHATTISNYGDIAIDEAEPVSQTYKLPDGAEAIRNAEIAIDTGKIQAGRDVLNSPVIPVCWCRTCRPVRITDMRFIVCPDCGNKRCPKANDHRNACSGSNEPGQDGSAYPAAPKQESE